MVVSPIDRTNSTRRICLPEFRTPWLEIFRVREKAWSGSSVVAVVQPPTSLPPVSSRRYFLKRWPEEPPSHLRCFIRSAPLSLAVSHAKFLRIESHDEFGPLGRIIFGTEKERVTTLAPRGGDSDVICSFPFLFFFFFLLEMF